MILPSQNLTPEERRALGIAAATAFVTGLAGGIASWAIDEGKRLLAEHREAAKKNPDEGSAL